MKLDEAGAPDVNDPVMHADACELDEFAAALRPNNGHGSSGRRFPNVSPVCRPGSGIAKRPRQN